jgi:hypothetical protein
MRKYGEEGVRCEGRKHPSMSPPIPAFCILSVGCGYQQVARPLLLESSGGNAVGINWVMESFRVSAGMVVIGRGKSSDLVFLISTDKCT